MDSNRTFSELRCPELEFSGELGLREFEHSLVWILRKFELFFEHTVFQKKFENSSIKIIIFKGVQGPQRESTARKLQIQEGLNGWGARAI